MDNIQKAVGKAFFQGYGLMFKYHKIETGEHQHRILLTVSDVKYNSDDEIGEVLNDYEMVDEIKKCAGISFYKHDGSPQEDILEPEDSKEKGCVYLIRNKDIYKIGITENALRRFGQLKPDEVINVVKCSNYKSLEKELHKKFKEFRIPQTEYFRFNKKQVKEVNNAMTKGADF